MTDRIPLAALGSPPGQALGGRRLLALGARQRLALRELRTTARDRWLDPEITERLRAMGYIQ